MASSNNYIYLKDYKKPNFQVEGIDLKFDILETSTKVTATARYQRLAPGPLSLNGLDFKLLSAKVDGKNIELRQPTTHSETWDLSVPDQFILEIITELDPKNNTSLEGLYQSRDIIVTQCEAQGFRKITYFMDRPDVMTNYSVTIEADKAKYPVLLSNGDRSAKVDLKNGRHQVKWIDPHKKPCYLFALVAGDLGLITDSFKTVSGRNVNLEIYASHGKQERCWHAMESLKKSMKWDEEAFGREYDLNDYMIVAIDDFNSGAMENKGLNIFNAKYVLADANSATDLDYELIEAIVAHEYFHNWTGNRITCRDWFQLSLKEGLTVFRDQEFSSDMGSRGVKRIDDVTQLRNRQFSEDGGPNAHPVRPSKAMSVDNFFTATIYEKGAELIRMMNVMTGKAGFRKGMDLYFARHDGQAVTTEDYAAAIATANNQDWEQFKLWYDQAGTPLVKISENYDKSKQTYKITFEQSCPPTPDQNEKMPFHIPIKFGLLGSNGKELAFVSQQTTKDSEGAPLIHLKAAKEVIEFSQVSERPVASLFRGFSAPVNVEWSRPVEDLVFLMANDSDEFNCWEAMTKLATQEFHRLLDDYAAKKTLTPDIKFAEAIKAVLRNESLDAGFKAKMIELPSDEYLIQTVAVFDADAFEVARSAIEKSIAIHCQAELLGIYKKFHNKDTDKFNAKIFGERALKNSALSLLMCAAPADFANLVEQQYKNAKVMTDKIAALDSVNDTHLPLREHLLNSFYQEWQADSLVLDKWFAIQARSRRSDTFDKIKELAKHPKFETSNPNKIYSLYRTFGVANLVQFNKPQVAAYFADLIIELDQKNPQVAARICSVFNNWKKLNPSLAQEFKVAIEKVNSFEKLSTNSKELISKMLITI
jgi:aminopeptidase N